MRRGRGRLRIGAGLATVIALAGAVAPAWSEALAETPWAPRETSRLALETATPAPLRIELPGKQDQAAKSSVTDADEVPVFNAERAQAFLQSLTVPGWGQAALGHTTSARVYALVEVGILTAFTAFRVQSEMRKESYETSARLRAGVDLRGRAEEFRRIVGSYLSSDEYNQFVVYRDAANLYLNDPNHPDYAGYRAYIASHSIGERDHWNWEDVESLLRYRQQRQDMQRAQQRANTTLILAGLNRLISAVHAAHMASHPGSAARSWNLEVSPSDVQDATAYRLEVSRRF
jgi:hypothetical protein